VARKPENPPTSKTPAIDPGTIRELAKLLDETGLTEIEIEANGASIRVARNAGFAAPRSRQDGIAAPNPTVVATPADIPIEPRVETGIRVASDTNLVRRMASHVEPAEANMSALPGPSYRGVSNPGITLRLRAGSHAARLTVLAVSGQGSPAPAAGRGRPGAVRPGEGPAGWASPRVP